MVVDRSRNGISWISSILYRQSRAILSYRFETLDLFGKYWLFIDTWAYRVGRLREEDAITDGFCRGWVECNARREARVSKYKFACCVWIEGKKKKGERVKLLARGVHAAYEYSDWLSSPFLGSPSERYLRDIVVAPLPSRLAFTIGKVHCRAILSQRFSTEPDDFISFLFFPSSFFFFLFSFFRFLVFSFFLSRGNGFINSAVKYFLVEWNVNAIRESNIALSFISFYFRYFFSLFFLVIFSGKRIRGWKISRKSYRSIISSILSIISSRRVQSERCYELFLI